MAIDADTLGDIGLRESFFHVADAGGEAAAFVGGEGEDSLSVKVDAATLPFESILAWLH